MIFFLHWTKIYVVYQYSVFLLLSPVSSAYNRIKKPVAKPSVYWNQHFFYLHTAQNTEYMKTKSETDSGGIPTGPGFVG